VESDTPSWPYPVPNIGYQEVSRMIQAGLNGAHDERVRIGEMVAMFGWRAPGQIAVRVRRARDRGGCARRAASDGVADRAPERLP
jgi:hypothetical protein